MKGNGHAEALAGEREREREGWSTKKYILYQEMTRGYYINVLKARMHFVLFIVVFRMRFGQFPPLTLLH